MWASSDGLSQPVLTSLQRKTSTLLIFKGDFGILKNARRRIQDFKTRMYECEIHQDDLHYAYYTRQGAQKWGQNKNKFHENVHQDHK